MCPTLALIGKIRLQHLRFAPAYDLQMTFLADSLSFTIGGFLFWGFTGWQTRFSRIHRETAPLLTFNHARDTATALALRLEPVQPGGAAAHKPLHPSRSTELARSAFRHAARSPRSSTSGASGVRLILDETRSITVYWSAYPRWHALEVHIVRQGLDPDYVRNVVRLHWIGNDWEMIASEVEMKLLCLLRSI